MSSRDLSYSNFVPITPKTEGVLPQSLVGGLQQNLQRGTQLIEVNGMDSDDGGSAGLATVNGTSPLQMYLIAGGAAAAASQGATAATGASATSVRFDTSIKTAAAMLSSLASSSSSSPSSRHVTVDHTGGSRQAPGPDRTTFTSTSDKRRATHNEVERRRRDTINTWIMKLGKLIPDLFASSNDAEPNAPSRSSQMSKGGILARACDYISELRQDNHELQVSASNAEALEGECERLREQLQALRAENEKLKRQLFHSQRQQHHTFQQGSAAGVGEDEDDDDESETEVEGGEMEEKFFDQHLS